MQLGRDLPTRVRTVAAPKVVHSSYPIWYPRCYPVLITDLGRMKGPELAQQREEIRRSDVTSTENQARVANIVRQRFTQFSRAV